MRIRVTFSKTGGLKYVGNLDLHKIWERAARRAGLDLAYTQAFHPQAKIQLASPLPLGFSSRCEVVDIRLNEDVDLSDLAARLQEAMPAGIRLLRCQEVDPLAPALQAEVAAAEYEITLAGAFEKLDLKRRIEELLASASVPRQRRGKHYDLRPLIEDLQMVVDDAQSEPIIRMRLTAREGATGRPEEVLDALGIPSEDSLIERTGLIFRA
jgi:radical SAM-linked protein